MKQLRYKNGKFKSKRIAQLENAGRLSATVILLTLAINFGIALQPYRIVVERSVVQAEEVQEEIISEPEEDDISNAYLPSDIDVSDETKEKIEKAINDIPHQSSTTEKWIAYIYAKSAEQGVDGDTMAHIAFCESSFHNVQSNCIYDFTDERIGIYKGQQERSYGIFMFSLPHHNITKEQALNPYFSTDRAIQIVKEGKMIWYGYKNDDCTNGIVPYWK